MALINELKIYKWTSKVYEGRSKALIKVESWAALMAQATELSLWTLSVSTLMSKLITTQSI